MLYTIPSLALFQLLVPVTGLTVTTVEVALVGYTLLILFRNILAGLRAAPPEVLEAARGMGLTPTADALARRAAARVAGDRRRSARGRRLDDRARDGRRVRRLARASAGRSSSRSALDFKTEIIAAGGLAVGLALVADGAARRRAAAADAVGVRARRAA